MVYGATYVFYNPKITGGVLMQGISRSFIPSLLDIMYPGSLSNLPRLNSILQSIVETIARNVGAKKIFVAPIGTQGKILEQHYGFVPDKSIKFPCDIIWGRYSWTREAYSKTIVYDDF